MSRVVVGVGHPARGDDAAGLEVARRVRAGGVTVASPIDLLTAWEGAEDAIVVDAARSGAVPGTIHRFDAAAGPLPTGLMATSTHSIGLAEVVELARVLGRLPDRLKVFGIEVADVAAGQPLSPSVAEAVRRVVEEIDRA
jgi:hydrogenase maturation protease